MKDGEFRALLDLMMCSDPWPVAGDNQKIVLAMLDNEAKKHGYDDHLFAYMHFQSGPSDKPVKKVKVTVAKKRTPRKTKAKGNKDE